MSTYAKLLQEQIRNEFTASHQYTAVAVWYDDQDLPQLAAHFYKQSLEERNHAMMMVQYLLDMDIRPHIPGVGEVVNEFASALEPLELALQQEITVTKQKTAYEICLGDWSSDVCSSDLIGRAHV